MGPWQESIHVNNKLGNKTSSFQDRMGLEGNCIYTVNITMTRHGSCLLEEF